ncbi:MAG: thioredoxin family protein [Clostridium sp.]|uniref:thioredoxin family protein n=1 Tax=Clostridium sp. TaxID=1506 RepID=UPI002FCA1ECA
MNYDDGLNYDEFISSSSDKETSLINTKATKVSEILKDIPQEVEARIKEISSPVKLAVFTETFCPDAAIAIPILLKVAALNPLIEVKFFHQREYEDYLYDTVDEFKIPTILNLSDDGRVIGKYIEFPAGLKNILNNKTSLQEVNLTIEDYRNGLFITEILSDITNLILGTQGEYVYFSKCNFESTG